MVDPVLFVLCALVMLLSLVMVLAKSPITSAFALVCLMVVLGGIYAFIGAHFVAAMQIIVYAGAVMVLFVFSIMLMNLNEERKFQVSLTGFSQVLAVITLFGLMAVAFLSWQDFSFRPTAGPFTLDTVKELGGNVFLLSVMIFSKAYVIFELIGLLFPIAVCGALVLAKRKVD